jgi:hypothetical protein
MGQLTQTTPQVQAILNKEMGWSDYNDAATASAPIALTVADTYYPLTNDELGGFTNKTYAIAGHGDIWDASSDEFDFSSLALGDTVDFRLDYTVTTTGANREICSKMALAIGASPYSLSLSRDYFKSAGTYQIVTWYSIYMGDSNTKGNPARFEVASDGTGDSVVVNGWYVRTQER